MHDVRKVKYFTNLLPYPVLKVIFNFGGVVDSKLDTFDQLMLVLIKLRLNLGDQDLAHRFGINQSTVLGYFAKNLDI